MVPVIPEQGTRQLLTFVKESWTCIATVGSQASSDVACVMLGATLGARGISGSMSISLALSNEAPVLSSTTFVPGASRDRPRADCYLMSPRCFACVSASSRLCVPSLRLM